MQETLLQKEQENEKVQVLKIIRNQLNEIKIWNYEVSIKTPMNCYMFILYMILFIKKKFIIKRFSFTGSNIRLILRWETNYFIFLFLEEKNKPLCLETVSNLTHEILYDNFNRKLSFLNCH